MWIEDLSLAGYDEISAASGFFACTKSDLESKDLEVGVM
jgi:hypothetical protein